MDPTLGKDYLEQHISWLPDISTLDDIVEKRHLPWVVQSEQHASPSSTETEGFNLDQPLLLYQKRKIGKVSARSVAVNKKTGAYDEVGKPLIIPEDYKGWFAVIGQPNDDSTPGAKVPHHTSVEELSKSDTDFFLIGGDVGISGTQLAGKTKTGKVQNFYQRQFYPGDILKKGSVYVGETRKKVGFFKKSKSTSEKYLMCTDSVGGEVIIPFWQKGMLYIVSQTRGNPPCPILQIPEIVKKKFVPCVVKLLYGRVPSVPCSFTGTMHFTEAYTEASVVAATINNLKNALLEITAGSTLRFKVADMNRNVVNTIDYRSALKLCENKSKDYVQNIRVCSDLDSKVNTPSKWNEKPRSENGNDYVQMPSGVSSTYKDRQQSFVRMSLGHNYLTVPLYDVPIENIEDVYVPALPERQLHRNDAADSPAPPPPCAGIYSNVPCERESVSSMPDCLAPRPPSPSPCQTENQGVTGSTSSDSGISDPLTSVEHSNTATLPIRLPHSQSAFESTGAIMGDMAVVQKRRPSLPLPNLTTVAFTAEEKVIFRASSTFAFHEGLQTDGYITIPNVDDIQHTQSQEKFRQTPSESFPVSRELKSKHDEVIEFARLKKVLDTVQRPEEPNVYLELIGNTETPETVPEEPVVDNRTLGACSLDYAMGDSISSQSDLGIEGREEKAAIARMSVEGLSHVLSEIGIHKTTIQNFLEEKVDGQLLLDLHDSSELKDCFPDIRNLDLHKISMLVKKGWRPVYV